MSETLILQIEHERERELRDHVAGLRPEEVLVLAFLKQRLSNKLI
ncbi:hypothetical protein J3A65_004505 [Rhizobium sp. PvP014]|nr:hypothetical protein [Rhizobium sp. PvP014]MBP2532200.1 hypothetical protein [Rhizobium sp. PvP099]